MDKKDRQCLGAQVLLLGKGTYNNRFFNIKQILLKKGITYREILSHKELKEIPHTLTFAFNYYKIIPDKYLKLSPAGVIVTHSTDLPRGKGFAPLYYAIANKQNNYTVSMFFASGEVDSGPIIAKAECAISPNETINTLRIKDDILTENLVENYIEKLLSCRYKGTPQETLEPEACFYEKRAPHDSEIDISLPLKDLLPQIKALPDEYPAFFYNEGVKVKIKVVVENTDLFDAHTLQYRINNYLDKLQ